MHKKIPKNEAWRTRARAYSPWLAQLLEAGDPAPFETFLHPPAGKLSTEGLMRELRLRKRGAALSAAAADLSGAWDDLRVMRALSDFADACVRAALRHLLREAHARSRLRLKDPRDPEKDCGVCVIALGKWGAHELNYSSDIDLMILFDPARAPVAEDGGAQAFFNRLARDLSRLLDQPTADGYVFRTDLRLRPDPGAMPLAVSLGAAENYYSTLGQNWERAAMIKARAAAGDAALGADFMKIMTAWIWRRNLDFAAIQDIHSIKRQINAAQARPGKAENPFLGFNVKLGHGGIREIEFFAQTQQLIYGGRDAALRAPDTLGALKALAEAGRMDEETRAALSAAYLFLRRTEHRLQMQEDRQTHGLPESAAGFAEVAAFMGCESAAQFRRGLDGHTSRVKELYAGLFTESPSLSAPGNLVFTGVEDDPETLATLRRMGFSAPETVTAAVRGWHHGRYRAVRSERARQILTEIAPRLLSILGGTAHPDEAFVRFDAFLSRLPAGVPLFSLFDRNPEVMEVVADVMGASPAMADYLGTHPQVLDGVLTRDFFGALPDAAWLRRELARLLDQARDYQDVLDVARRFAHERRFHAGVHILRDLSPDAACRRYFSDIAETVLRGLVPHVEKEFARAHGTFRTGKFILLALGGFGAGQMFFDSDLDLVALYDVDAAEKESGGARPLPPSLYYIRLTQRLVAALSAPTAEGVLYETDLRLRPDGNKGPLASAVPGFLAYHENSAWTWEHMSLMRARPVYGDAHSVMRGARKVLSRKRDGATLKKDLRDMRKKIEKQSGTKDIWQVKHARGGLMDVLFTAQFHALLGAAGDKSLLLPDVAAGLDALRKKKRISAQDHKTLAAAHETAMAAASFLRLCAETPFRPAAASKGLRQALARRIAPGKTFAQCAALLRGRCAESFRVFKKTFK